MDGVAVVAVAVIGMLAAATGVSWWRRRRLAPQDIRPLTPPEQADVIGRADIADLDARFAAVAQEHAREIDELLASRLRPLVVRGVPVCRVEPIPFLRAARVSFADGTALVAKGAVPGDLGVLAAALRAHRVRPWSWSSGQTGTRLELGWKGDRHRLSLVVTGLDQPS